MYFAVESSRLIRKALEVVQPSQIKRGWGWGVTSRVNLSLRASKVSQEVPPRKKISPDLSKTFLTTSVAARPTLLSSRRMNANEEGKRNLACRKTHSRSHTLTHALTHAQSLSRTHSHSHKSRCLFIGGPCSDAEKFGQPQELAAININL